jgi:hypothetical protein
MFITLTPNVSVDMNEVREVPTFILDPEIKRRIADEEQLPEYVYVQDDGLFIFLYIPQQDDMDAFDRLSISLQEAF